MTTIIHSNGSKWAGEKPDSIEKLLEVLATEPLERTFEDCGNFAYNHEIKKGFIRFFGNFHKLSHGFNIESDDEGVCAKLVAAIKANKKLPGYRSQPNREERRAAKRARAEEQRKAFAARRGGR